MIGSVNDSLGVYVRATGGCPPDVATVSPQFAGIRDPFGGTFELDRDACRIYATSMPELTHTDVPSIF